MRFLKLEKKGWTLIEVITVLAIIAIGVVWSFAIIWSGQKLSNNTESTIKAINIARDGIEWLTVIRNTNWIRFSSDRANCWNAKWYDMTLWVNCIGEVSMVHDSKIWTGSYVITSVNGIWSLSGITTAGTTASYSGSSWPFYLSTYRVSNDDQWFAIQNGTSYPTTCTTYTNTGCMLKFAREIHITYSGTGSMQAQSIVRWLDPAYSGSAMYKHVILETSLTNWKNNF